VFNTILDSNILELGIFGFLRCGENKGGVCGGILRLVFADCCSISVLHSQIYIDALEGGLRTSGRCGSLHAKSPVNETLAQFCVAERLKILTRVTDNSLFSS
jgi:hypothetical protein